ncbi:MAG: alpha/beta fold hydrolase [Gammaproteobacteria bacterium]
MSFPDFPFSSRFATVNGRQMHYLDEGPSRATTVVMLHGNPTWSFYFRKVGSCRCIVPDHIGMGLSEKPAGNSYRHTLSRRVDDLEELLEQLAVKQGITLILHDWGGMIGMAYAIRYPDRIKRLVIMNTTAFHLEGMKPLPWQLILARIPLIGATLVQGFNAFCRGAVRRCVTREPMAAETRKAYLAPYDSWRHRLAVLRFVQDIPLHPGDPAYDTVSKVEAGLGQFRQVPMLICWGLQDFVFDEPFLAEWIERFPHAEVRRFNGAGHYVLEDAADEIVPLVKQFLDKHPVE